MAKLDGGIFSRPRGKTADIVFGAARTREGKVTTARQYVRPSNPNTPAQQAQRTKFSDAVAITKAIGPGIYQEDLNRMVGQLPGFQSVQSVMVRNLDAALDMTLPDDVALGSLHFPDTATAAGGAGSGQIEVTYSSELGANGTAADVVVGFAIPVDSANRVATAAVVEEDTRNGPPLRFQGLIGGADYIIGFYLRGEGTAEGELSLLKYFEATATV